MLKLKYLFNNPDLALMIVKNWIDTEEVSELFQYFRISSNAIYPFRIEDQVYFLRFAPIEKMTKENALAELEFLSYLKEHHYSVVETIPSKKGNELEIVNTPWGTYYAVVFKRVIGEKLSEESITDDLVFKWGKGLGQLHQLSKRYRHPNNQRNNYKDQFKWMKEVLENIPNQESAKTEISILESFFDNLDRNEDHYGLIHYDFEMDNVFYNQELDRIIPIDFDDSVYHFFVMDIERSINSIREELPEEKFDQYQRLFLEGYKTEMEIDDQLFSMLPIFTRYANLYGYVRVLLSINEKWDHEPEWMRDLREHLGRKLNQRKSEFGKPIYTDK